MESEKIERSQYPSRAENIAWEDSDENKKESEVPQSPKGLIKEFCSYTSTHGLGRLAEATTLFSRSIWTVFILGAFAMFIYQTCGLFSLYLRRPVSTVVKEKYKTGVTFPAVTICNQNAVKLAQLMGDDFDAIYNESKKRLEEEKKKSDQKDGQNMTGNNNTYDVLFDYIIKDVFASYFAMQNYTTFSKLGHEYKRFVFDCSFRGNDCSDSYSKYWRQFVDYRYGNCFTFNGGIDDEFKMQTTLETDKSGSSGGLELNLFIELSEYFEYTQMSGATIVIHNQGKMPFPEEEGINLVPGTSTSVGVRRKVFKRVDPFNNGSCREADSNGNDDFYHKRFGTKYSRETCLRSCLAKIQIKQCGCADAKYPADNRHVCNLVNDRGSELCLDDLRARLNDDQDFLKCDSNCSVSCSDVNFETTVSSASWPSSVYQGHLVRRVKRIPLKPSDKEKLSLDGYGFVKENLLQVKVFFEQLNFQEVKEELSYKEVNLLADIGGQLGLWIGISVLTCCEVFELVLLMIQSLIKRMTTKAGRVEARE